ncbi:MAG: FAD-dependent oxidoreductase [Oligoflexales bacterium]|nr:FAD-dependent oxidoreductase [Oligoflexales bacterium]
MSNSNSDNKELDEKAKTFKNCIDIKDRTYGFPRKKFESCFVGQEAVDAIIKEGLAKDLEEALELGNLLLNQGYFHHVQRAHQFKYEYLFYRFTEDEDHGEALTDTDGKKFSWSDLMPRISHTGELDLQANIPDPDKEFGDYTQVALDASPVSPMDEYNIKLLDNVMPRSWKNPKPKKKYHLVALGGGAGGLISSAGAAGVGARSAIIESHMLGGDCLNVGCVPSKALIYCAKAIANIKKGDKLGLINTDGVSIDFSKVMERMRKLRSSIAPVDSAERYSKDLGVDVFLGKGKFTGPNTIEVDGETLEFARAVVATGGTATIPPIPGLAEAPILTNSNVFNLTKLPKRVAVIGSGPIGLELAQCFKRFGSEVR